MVKQLDRLKYKVLYEALDGEVECGDQYLVKELDNSILIAVADGLGHGTEAARASKAAMKILGTYANESFETLVQRCNRDLNGTRGVALTLVRIHCVTHTLAYLAIGNVIGVYWQLSEILKLSKTSFLLQSGIVGSRLPSSLLHKEITIHSGDVLILATDGINEKFETELPTFESPDTLAKRIFKMYRSPIDDGLILVAKFP